MLRDVRDIVTAVAIIAVVALVIYIIYKLQNWQWPKLGWSNEEQKPNLGRIEGTVTHRNVSLSPWEYAILTVDSKTVTVRATNSTYWISNVTPGIQSLKAELYSVTSKIAEMNYNITVYAGQTTYLPINFP